MPHQAQGTQSDDAEAKGKRSLVTILLTDVGKITAAAYDRQDYLTDKQRKSFLSCIAQHYAVIGRGALTSEGCVQLVQQILKRFPNEREDHYIRMTGTNLLTVSGPVMNRYFAKIPIFHGQDRSEGGTSKFAGPLTINRDLRAKKRKIDPATNDAMHWQVAKRQLPHNLKFSVTEEEEKAKAGLLVATNYVDKLKGWEKCFNLRMHDIHSANQANLKKVFADWSYYNSTFAHAFVRIHSFAHLFVIIIIRRINFVFPFIHLFM